MSAPVYRYARLEDRRGPSGPWHAIASAGARTTRCGRMLIDENASQRYARVEVVARWTGPLICRECQLAESLSRELLPCAFLKGKAS